MAIKLCLSVGMCLYVYTHVYTCARILWRYQDCMVENSAKNRFYCITMPSQLWNGSRIIQLVDYFSSWGTVLPALGQYQRFFENFCVILYIPLPLESISSCTWHAPLVFGSCSSGGESSAAGRVLQSHLHSRVGGVVTLVFTKIVSSGHFRLSDVLPLCSSHRE